MSKVKQVFRAMLRAIVRGELGHRGAMLSESEIAKVLKVGRSTVREAVAVLDSRGLLEVDRGFGVRAHPISERGTLDLLPDLFEVADAGERVRLLRSLCAVREAVWGELGARAASGPTANLVRRLGQALERFDVATMMGAERADCDEVEREFRTGLCQQAGGGGVIPLLLRSLDVPLETCFASGRVPLEVRVRRTALLGPISTGLASRDPARARAAVVAWIAREHQDVREVPALEEQPSEPTLVRRRRPTRLEQAFL